MIKRTFMMAALAMAASSALAEPGLVKVTGFGTINPAMAATDAQAKMLAKRAAQLDAQRQLSEQVKGLEIRAGSTVEDYEVKSDIIATRVKTWLKGGFVIEQKVEESEGTWVAEVVMGICITNESAICKNQESLKAIADAASH